MNCSIVSTIEKRDSVGNISFTVWLGVAISNGNRVLLAANMVITILYVARSQLLYDLQHSEDIKIYGINDQDNDAWNASSSNDKKEAG